MNRKQRRALRKDGLHITDMFGLSESETKSVYDHMVAEIQRILDKPIQDLCNQLHLNKGMRLDPAWTDQQRALASQLRPCVKLTPSVELVIGVPGAEYAGRHSLADFKRLHGLPVEPGDEEAKADCYVEDMSKHPDGPRT